MSLKLSPRGRTGRLLPLLTALLTSACAEDGLETASLQVADPQWTAETSSGVTRQPLPPVESALARTQEPAQVTMSPETLSAIRDARALRDAGNKARALGMLEKTTNSDKDPSLLLERGLLSLELGQIDRAEELLRKAHDPNAPDWRQHSALGAALSAQGKQQAAQEELARALKLAPDNPAVLNNLALSYALDGKHAEAERLLRQAADHNGGNAQAKQNLALILGLRGNVEEAQRVSETVLPPDKVKSNVAYLEQLRTGSEHVSKADPVPVESIRAAAAAIKAEDSDQPIMQLDGAN
jgi:Flp pilus assembly protein TadD